MAIDQALPKSLAAAADLAKTIGEDIGALETKLVLFKAYLATAHPLLSQVHQSLLAHEQAVVAAPSSVTPLPPVPATHPLPPKPVENAKAPQPVKAAPPEKVEPKHNN